MREKLKTVISYGAPALLVLFLMSVILLVQGIWPFGSQTVDFYDMAQQLAAEYLQIYDELHGTKSLIYDWYTCLGRGIPGGTYLALTNLLYYFVPRDMILETFSIMLVIKTMGMAVTMRIFLKKELSSCPDFFSIILSAGYGLCGFVFMQYTIIVWLDIAMLVPLVLMYTQRLLRYGKMTGYIVCLSLMLMISFYIPVMVLLFIFIMTGIYILSQKIKQKDCASGEADTGRIYVIRLGIATAAAIMLQAWTWLPKVLSASGSMRFDNEAESGLIAQYIKILTHVQPDYSSRLWCLLGVSFAAAVSVVGMVGDFRRKNHRKLFFVLSAFAVLLLQLVFENIQLFWHFGSYVNYPTRDGFLMYIVFAAVAASYASEVLKKNESSLSSLYTMSGIVAAVLITSAMIYWYKINEGMSVYTVFRVSVLFAMACFLLYLFIIVFKRGKYAKLAVFLICSELIFYGVILVGKPLYITGYSEEPEQEGDYILTAGELDELMNIPSSRLDRIKNPDTTLNTNYGAVLQRATFTGWPSGLSADIVSSAYNMGYSTQYTRILDAGGNAFTDALLHTTQLLSIPEQDNELYEKVDSARVTANHITGEQRTYSLYNCRYVLPFGTVVNNSEALAEIGAAFGPVDFANAVYRGIGSDDENIAERIETGELNKDFSIKAEGRKLLYITGSSGDSEAGNIRVYVNGGAIPVPTIKNPDNVYYTAHFNNNSLYLGSSDNEEVTIRIEKDENVSEKDYDFILYSIDLEKLEDLCEEYRDNEREISASAGKRNLSIHVNGRESEWLMLPLEYSSDWQVSVNGIKANPACVNGLMMAVPLVDGENNITMEYFPRSMKLGIIVSLIALALCVLTVSGSLIGKRMGNTVCIKITGCFATMEEKAAKKVSVLYMCAWALLMTGMYVVTSIYGIFYYLNLLAKG